MKDPLDHPNVVQRLVRRLARSWLGSRIFSTLAPPVDRWTLRLTIGKFSATTLMAGYPVITLETIGAKSVLPRQVSLLAAPDGENLVLVASNFGNTRHPAWYLNLSAHPEVKVIVQGDSRAYIAKTAEGSDRQRLWELAVAYYPGYRAYTKWTRDREIPVVVLTPTQQ